MKGKILKQILVGSGPKLEILFIFLWGRRIFMLLFDEMPSKACFMVFMGSL